MINSEFYNFNTVYIEKSIKNNTRTKRILERIIGNPEIHYVEDLQQILKTSNKLIHPTERSKKLILSSIKGEILQKCPGSHGHICCNYFVINSIIGCPINCSYCILQSYLNQPAIIINVDLETIFEELKNIFKNNPNKLYRIGTGELSDSLVYEPITQFSKEFIEFFSHYPQNIFEFKTKTDYIDNILQIDSPGNIVVGFSVNPQITVDKEEGFAVSIKRRIEAAKKLQAKGYSIALHFDPIIFIEDFEREYSLLIEYIFNNIDNHKIAWISLGTFRYNSKLKKSIQFNYFTSNILTEEFIKDKDNKFRYFYPIRERLYNIVINKIKSFNVKAPIYLCMESPQIWKNTIGFLPYKEEKIDLLFRNAIKQN